MSEPFINRAILAGGTAGVDRPTQQKLQKAAEEFEAVFLSQMLSTFTQDLAGPGAFGEGEGGEDVFRDMYTQELAKLISRTGGIGVADSVLQEMLKTQEVM